MPEEKSLPPDPDVEELPTLRVSSPALPELARLQAHVEEPQTIRMSVAELDTTVTALPADEIELPTIRIAPAKVPQALRDLDVTCDALPAELLQKALPFVPLATEEHTIDCIPGSTSAPLPFVAPQETAPQKAVAPIRHVEPPKPVAVVAPPAAPDPFAEITDVARLAAAVAATGARALAREGVSAETWASREAACAATLAIEAERRERRMRDAYDDAFLEARALHRGSFGAEACVELRVEVGAASEGLAELALDVADAIRFRRVSSRTAPGKPKPA